jgi:hypothetical protein
MGGRGFLTMKWSSRIAQGFYEAELALAWVMPPGNGPESNPYPLRGCNSDLAQYSHTPSLRVAEFEDEDEDDDENEAPCEGDRRSGAFSKRQRLSLPWRQSDQQSPETEIF